MRRCLASDGKRRALAAIKAEGGGSSQAPVRALVLPDAPSMAAGEITVTGAVPPEVAVPCAPFFERLRVRKMKVVASRKAGWGFAT